MADRDNFLQSVVMPVSSVGSIPIRVSHATLAQSSVTHDHEHLEAKLQEEAHAKAALRGANETPSWQIEWESKVGAKTAWGSVLGLCVLCPWQAQQSLLRELQARALPVVVEHWLVR